MKLGSLFDGSGGFPLAGTVHGVNPVWASEIEPYPVRVTKARFPHTKHLGDVTKINGAEIEPVDIVTFGSPCQDLSVAGKQAGLHDGERSNLFFEAIRIIEEMRNATNKRYPRIAVWENVPGAFSSRGGADFRAVLQAFVGISDPGAVVPVPPFGAWKSAGCIVGSGYSIAWRTLDAQYWGVPQRRKRIYLVADFGSERAGEVLFKQEGLRGHPAESGEKGESTSEDVKRSVGRGVFCDLYNHAITGDVAPSLNANSGASANHAGPSICTFMGGQGADTAGCNGAGWRENERYTLNTIDRPVVAYALREFGQFVEGNPTLRSSGGDNGGGSEGLVCYRKTAHPRNADEAQGWGPTDKADTLNVFDNSENRTPLAVLHMASGQSNAEIGVNVACTLTNDKDRMPVCYTSRKPHRKYIIRRLTPLECCRLQGFPDWWEDGVEGSDSARYKMWGNGIALPNAAFVIGCAVELIGGTHG